MKQPWPCNPPRPSPACLPARSANLNDDRIAARIACYKECLDTDGWDPVCMWNPAYPKPTTHGGGEFVYPNK